jgi:hypothetical protein
MREQGAEVERMGKSKLERKVKPFMCKKRPKLRHDSAI